MYIFFEKYPYDATAKAVRDGLVGCERQWQNIDKKIAVDYVGYYFEPTVKDCVFILPKVLLKDVDKETYLVVNKDYLVCPEDIITPEGQRQKLADHEEFRHFLYNFAIWIYRTLSVYRDKHPNSQAIYSYSLPQAGSGRKQKINTYLDVILSLIRFDIENQNFFLYTVKNQHSGLNKINWTRTISKSQAILHEDNPIYLQPVNKKRQINFAEELFVIFFSILAYCNEEYGFHAPICLHYPLLSKQQIERYRETGLGANRLRQIRYKYFSDKALELWDLCYTFFNLSHELYANTNNKEFLLASKYHIIFESMIDTLVGEPHDNIPSGLQDQDDGKMVDHMYTDLALSSSEEDIRRDVYYIGDSKYYSIGHPLTTESVAKQYTYARNVIQWNIDFWNFDDNRKAKEKGDKRFKSVRLRMGTDEPNSVEGYDIIPNFFISAFVDENHRYDDRQENFRIHNSKTTYSADGETELGGVHISTQFPNRLFDRDTLILSHYDVNFLYVMMLYARDRSFEQDAWKMKIRRHFRQQVQKVLEERYCFYAMKPKNIADGVQYIQSHFKDVIGKLYQPQEYVRQHLYILALEKEQGITPKADGVSLLHSLAEQFEIKPCLATNKQGEKVVKMDAIPNEIRNYQPLEISNNDRLLFVTAEGSRFDAMVNKIEDTGKIGIALQINGATLQLVEGFTKAHYLVVHNKSDKQRIFMFDSQGPILIPQSGQETMAVTKMNADLYLVYNVRTGIQVHLGKLDLSIITQNPAESYNPQLHRLSEVQK